MQVLWEASGPLPGRDVWQRIIDDEHSLARTTVLTVLSRLEAKGLVSRGPEGRYRPVRAEAAAAADEMQQLLVHAEDRQAALVQFAGMLPYEDLLALTRALQKKRPRT